MRYLFIFFVIMFYSCGVVNKVFHKTKQSVDSTSVVTKKKDSIVTKDSFAVHKENVISDNKIVIEFGNNDTSIARVHVNRQDYVEFDWKKGTIKSTQSIKRITMTGSQQLVYTDSLANHSKIEAHDTLSDNKHLKKNTVEVSNTVHRMSIPWWCFLILILIVLLIVLLIVFWKKIKPFILTILPI